MSYARVTRDVSFEMGSILAENYPIRYEFKKGQAARQKEGHVFGASVFIGL
jgi:hypothetical protein